VLPILVGFWFYPIRHCLEERSLETRMQSEELCARTACHLFQVEASWNVMAHAQKQDFVFRRNGRVHLNRRGRQFCRLLAAEVCASAAVMLDTPCSEVVWRVLATHSIRQFPHSLSLPCVAVCHHISTGVLNVRMQVIVFVEVGASVYMQKQL
jgi:hypothetical protein